MRAPSGASSSGGFFNVRAGSRPREGLPRPLALGLVGLGLLGVIAALVTLLLSTSKPKTPIVNPAPAVTESPIPGNPAGLVNPVPNPQVLTDAASPVPAETRGATAGAEPLVSPGLTASPPSAAPTSGALAQTSGGGALRADSTATAAAIAPGDTAAVTTPAPKPPGILKITMQQQPPTDAGAIFQQALAAQRRGDVTRAKELYARALDRDSQNADLYNNIGMLYRSTGELDRAEDAYRHAIALNPRLAAAWSNLGVLLDARGRRKEAVSALQQAIAIDPANTGVKVNLALQYHASGLFADARRLLEEALRTNPTMPEAHYALARTLEAQGERSSAIQHYDLFLTTANGRFPQLERQVAQHLVKMKAGS